MERSLSICVGILSALLSIALGCYAWFLLYRLHHTDAGLFFTLLSLMLLFISIDFLRDVEPPHPPGGFQVLQPPPPEKDDQPQ